MCGIFGFVGGPDAHAAEVLATMSLALGHRGPDDSGTCVDGEFKLGITRLSIIDLAGGRQPMSNEDGTVWIVQNGEIYNHEELRLELAAAGHRFRTRSDTEAVVHSYEDDGPACVSRLRGMFAFAILDRRDRSLLLARDRLGIKPLYYCETPGGLVWASELKALLAHPDVPREVDLAAIFDCLHLGYVPGPRTMLKGVRKLLPGHLLRWRAGQARAERYWRLPCGTHDDRTEEDWVAEFEERFRDCVRLHLLADVPVGAFLSGGVDSSYVVATMARLAPGRVQTFSVGFEGVPDFFDEAPFARRVSEFIGTSHQEVTLRPSHYAELAEDVVWHSDEPLADSAATPTMVLSRLAGRSLKVVLTGEGADETFAGYSRYLTEARVAVLESLPRAARTLLARTTSWLPGTRRYQPLAAAAALCPAERYLRQAPLYSRAASSLWSASMLAALAGHRTEAAIEERIGDVGAASAVDRYLALDCTLWLPDDLLMKVDKMTMSASLEARVPYLDHRMVELAARVPPALKLRGRRVKHLLRRAAARLLPAEIVERPKHGFNVPISSWLRRELKPWLTDWLSPERLRRRSYLDAARVHGLLADHLEGRADHGQLLYGLALLEIWGSLYLERGRPLRAPGTAPATLGAG